MWGDGASVLAIHAEHQVYVLTGVPVLGVAGKHDG